MKKYEVTLSASTVLIVDAHSREEASALAMNAPYDSTVLDWNVDIICERVGDTSTPADVCAA